MRKLVTTALLLALSVTQASAQTYEDLREAALGQLHVTGDEFDSELQVVGRGLFIGDSDDAHARLRSFVPNDGTAVRHQIYVQINYRVDPQAGALQFWNRASLRGGATLKVEAIDRSVARCLRNFCTLKEILGITVPDRTLRTAQHGLTLKLSARTGDSMLIELDQEKVTAQLAMVDSLRRSAANLRRRGR